MAVRATRLGVVGYGVGGRHFHTPFIEAATGIELVGVVTRSPERRSLAEQDWPGVPVHDSLTSLLDAGVDAVTITTPPDTRRELVLEAVAAGVHVVADKPFAPTAAIGRDMTVAASKAGVLLSVYHNRRWDADIRTLKAVLEGGRVGELSRVYSQFDQDDPSSIPGGEAGGVLRDLGTHVIDQMIWLLGPVTSVTGHLDWVDLPDGRTDSGFSVDLLHTSGVASHVEASKSAHASARELRVYGTRGSYRSHGTDVQAQAVFAGQHPAADPSGWGYEEPHFWGTLSTAAGEVRIASAQGRWHDFYSQFAAAARGEAEQPVPASEALHTVEVIDAARKSALDGRSVEMSPT
jgi:predicted dehydrogenase